MGPGVGSFHGGADLCMAYALALYCAIGPQHKSLCGPCRSNYALDFINNRFIASRDDIALVIHPPKDGFTAITKFQNL